MEVSLQLKRWFEASLQSLIDGIESVDKILPFLRGKDVISDSDCKEILAERGEKQRVELCLLKVIKNDQTSLYRNVWAALSLPYPRLYADVCIRLHERFGPAVLEGLPSPQVQAIRLNPQLGVPEPSRTISLPSSNLEVLKVRLEYQQELDLVRAQLETLQTEMMTLKSVVDEERREKESISQDMISLEHQYRTAKREREEAIKELDQRVKERYDMQQLLQEALRDLDEVTAKNDGLNVQLQQIAVVMKDRDEVSLELEKIKRQRDQAISDRKNLSERKAQVESELESTLLRYEESIKESEGKGEEQKKLTRELMKLQMQTMELQLENSKLKKDLQMMHEMEMRIRERGLASPRDSGVSGDMRGWDGVKLKITLSMSQEVVQEKRANAGIVLESGLFVKELVREGVAAMDGQLVVGDRLLEVNGHRHVNDILDLIEYCKSELVLTVGRVVPRTRPVHVVQHNSPTSRVHTLRPQPHNTVYPSTNSQRKYTYSGQEQYTPDPRTSTFPYRSGYNPLSHHTSDNISVRSFAYNPNSRPAVSSPSQKSVHYSQHQLVSHADNPPIHVSASISDFQRFHGHTQPTHYQPECIQQSYRMKAAIRRRSLSSPDPSSQIHLEKQSHPYHIAPESPFSSGTLVDNRQYSQQTCSQHSQLSIDKDVSEQKQAMSASQSALYQVESSDSDDDNEIGSVVKKRSVNVESGTTSTSTSGPASVQTDGVFLSLAQHQVPSPSLETLTAEPQLSASGFPMVGSSLTTTDMKLAIRGPDILISQSVKASTKEARRTSTKMPTFLKDPKMIDVKKYESRNCRYIELTTSAVSCDIGFSIIGGRGVGIFVSAIHEKVHVQAGLRVGDQILELNGIDLIRSTYEKASATLSFVSFGGGAVMCVEHKGDRYSQLQPTCRDDFHVRVLFDYHPEQGEMALKEGDILHVKDTMYEDNIDVWLVTRLPKGKYLGETGCVPSRSRARLFHRPTMKRMPSFPPPLPPSTPMKRRGSWRQRFGRKGKGLALEETKDLGTPTESQRRHLSMSPVQDIMGTRENSITIEEPIVPVNNAMALFEAAKNVPADETPAGYEYVEKVFYDSLRPVLIIGPLASVMANRLTQEDPMRFSLALPEFFETYDEVQKGLQDHSIIYCSQRSAYGNYACITANIVKKIAEQNQHCLLDVGPYSIPRLKGADLKPIIIFLAPKSERKLRSCCMQLNISAVEAHSMFVDARRIGQEYQSCFSGEVSLGSSLDRCMIRVRDMVQTHQNKVEWVAVPE